MRAIRAAGRSGKDGAARRKSRTGASARPPETEVRLWYASSSPLYPRVRRVKAGSRPGGKGAWEGNGRERSYRGTAHRDPHPFPPADLARAGFVLVLDLREHGFDGFAGVHPPEIRFRRNQKQAMHPVFSRLDGLGIGGEDYGEVTGDEKAIRAGRFGIFLLESLEQGQRLFEIPVQVLFMDAFLVQAGKRGRSGGGVRRPGDARPRPGRAPGAVRRWDGPAKIPESGGDGLREPDK